EVHARGDRELQRAPKPAIHFHEAWWADTIVAELHHRGAVPLQRREQALGRRTQACVERHGPAQAAAGARGAYVAQAFVCKPGDGATSLTQREYALAAPGDEPLHQRPVLSLRLRQDRSLEFVGCPHVPDARVLQEANAVPGVAEAALHDQRETQVLRRRPALGERGWEAGRWDGHPASLRVFEGSGFVEGAEQRFVRGAAHRDTVRFPLVPFRVAQEAGPL